MLVIYPTQDWKTFLSEIEADEFMAKQTDDGGWSNLATAQKEMLLIQTASQIRLCKGIKLPTTLEGDLKEGQAYLLLQASRIDMTVFDHNEKDITKEKVGSLEVDYAYRDKNMTSTTFPPMASLFLKQYGCSGNSGFSQSSTVKA